MLRGSPFQQITTDVVEHKMSGCSAEITGLKPSVITKIVLCPLPFVSSDHLDKTKNIFNHPKHRGCWFPAMSIPFSVELIKLFINVVLLPAAKDKDKGSSTVELFVDLLPLRLKNHGGPVEFPCSLCAPEVFSSFLPKKETNFLTWF